MIYGRAIVEKGRLNASPLSSMARLYAMAAANVLIEIPEGCRKIREGSLASAWFF
jgi:molybdopterin biosynthesis enzyme